MINVYLILASSVSALFRVYLLGLKLHPAITPRGLKHRGLMLISAFSNLVLLRQWYGTTDNPMREKALQRYPLIEGAIYWPYINHNWTTKRRLQTIDKHYRMLDVASTVIADATLEDRVLIDCEQEYLGLKLVLEKAPWFLREGEIVLSIFVGIDRVYSVAFTIGEENGRRVIYVGALQGRNLENAMEIYRNLTHALHGLRPRDFLLNALKMLCSSIGIDSIWGISSDCRQHNSKYFSGSHREKLLADYDEVWKEHGGIEMDNGFFQFPAIVVYKEMSEISTRKRANYRRRYAMLRKLELDIDEACKH
jgi:uncharacterized protein